MYVDSLAQSGRVISPSRPLYTEEYIRTVEATQFNAYGGGPRVDFSGEPKAVLEDLGTLSDSTRVGVEEGRGVGVVHPPGYHTIGAGANFLAGNAALPTRMWWVRVVSALFGVVAVYATWLLASVVLGGAIAPLCAAALTATQPMIGYLSGLVNHDIALIAAFTLALALATFVSVERPNRWQGIGMGVAVAAALWIKASALVLLPIVFIALLAQGLRWREWQETGSVAVVWAATVTAGVGGWFAYSIATYGSVTGVVLAPVAADAGASLSSVTLGDYLLIAREWFGQTYRTAWFHYLGFEAPAGRWYYFVPAFAVMLGLLGAVGGVVESLRRREYRFVVHASLLIAATSAIALPFLGLDVLRRADGQGFLVDGGRYLLPAYPAMAVLCVFGVRWLVRKDGLPIVSAFSLTLAGTFCAYVWKVHYADRYFGDVGLSEQMRRISFDRPEFVTTASLTALLTCIIGLALVFAGSLVKASRTSTD